LTCPNEGICLTMQSLKHYMSFSSPAREAHHSSRTPLKDRVSPSNRGAALIDVARRFVSRPSRILNIRVMPFCFYLCFCGQPLLARWCSLWQSGVSASVRRRSHGLSGSLTAPVGCPSARIRVLGPHWTRSREGTRIGRARGRDGCGFRACESSW
jgi:hypothetical protein